MVSRSTVRQPRSGRVARTVPARVAPVDFVVVMCFSCVV